jgi:O-antigen/teichoic acid export membrane protein
VGITNLTATSFDSVECSDDQSRQLELSENFKSKSRMADRPSNPDLNPVGYLKAAQSGLSALVSVPEEAAGEDLLKQQHFTTAHLLTSLKRRTISGAFITIGAQGAQFVLSLASIMVLARLLTPKDFGLFAMVTTVMGYLRVFKDAGLSTATVQREGITHAQVSNLFWINVAVSGAISLIFAGSSPIVAWFYREPRLVPITLVLSSTFLLSGLTIQHTALLNRQMRFKAVAFIQVGSLLIGVAVGIGMAWLNYNYWALVFSNLITVAAAVPLTWFAIPWRPQAPSRHSGIRSLLSFGANMATGGFIYSLARGADGMLIGRFYGPDSVGLYTRAAALLNRPMEQFLGPISLVFVPVLSRVQTQPERYRRTFLQVYESMALISFLGTGLLLALARPLTLVVLGPKWEQAALIFAGFTIAALCIPLTTASTWLFASQGRGKDWLFASSLVSLITAASFVAGLPFGPAGVAIVYSAAGLLVGLPVLYYFAGRQGPVTTGDLWIGFFRYLPLWAVVCGTTWLMRLLFSNSAPLVQLVICVPVGLIAGLILICILTPMRRVALGLVDILKELKSRRVSSNTS